MRQISPEFSQPEIQLQVVGLDRKCSFELEVLRKKIDDHERGSNHLSLDVLAQSPLPLSASEASKEPPLRSKMVPITVYLMM